MNLAHGLGRIPSPPDPRDYRMGDAMRLMPKHRARIWPCAKVLNQGRQPACVGFSWAHWGIASPVEDNWGNPVGYDIYRAAKTVDGNSQDGSTIRSGAKVMLDRGRLGSYFWARSAAECFEFLEDYGPVVAGTAWFSRMMQPSTLRKLLVPRGQIVGGHAYLINAIDDRYVYVHQSWGPEWGENGRARIRLRDFEYLFSLQGEVCAGSELPLNIGRT